MGVGVANLCSAACCVWTAAQPGGSVERRPLVWTSPRADSVHSAEDWAPFSGEKQQRCSGGPGASCLGPWIPPFHDGPRVEGCGCPWRIWTRHSVGDAWICVDREGRGWESLGTDARLIDMAEGLMRSHLKIHLYSSLERVFDIFNMHLCVCVFSKVCLTSWGSRRTATWRQRIISERV